MKAEQRPYEKPCRACEAAIRMTREEIRALAERMRMAESGALLEDADVDARLELCEVCEALIGGATCLHCGCIVPLRAMYAARECPHPEGPRWTVRG